MPIYSTRRGAAVSSTPENIGFVSVEYPAAADWAVLTFSKAANDLKVGRYCLSFFVDGDDPSYKARRQVVFDVVTGFAAVDDGTSLAADNVLVISDAAGLFDSCLYQTLDASKNLVLRLYKKGFQVSRLDITGQNYRLDYLGRY